jgi:hypothetical protein
MPVIPEDEDNMTIIASNMSSCRWSASYPSRALAAMETPSKDAIANSGVAQIFVVEETLVKNKRRTTCPLKVMLANGQQVWTTHMCNINIPGLPITLTGCIIPNLTIASLFGIQVLTEVGCTVTFNIDKHVVKYNGKEILHREKDNCTDLWILPLGNGMTQMTTQHDRVMPVLACPKMASAHTCLSMQESTNESPTAFFTHTTRSKANNIKFAHQLLCSPRISTLLKAICHGYLKGCPNLTAAGVTRYLNPSTALAKGHMKRPHQGI